MKRTLQHCLTPAGAIPHGDRPKRQPGIALKKLPPSWLLPGWVAFLFSVFCFPEDIADTKVSFQAQGHFIVVKGSMGELQDLNLVIDTGASSTTVSPRVAKKLGLKGDSKQVLAYAKKVEVISVVLPILELGSMRFEQVPAWVAQLSFPDARRMLRIDALIGLDLLKRTNLSVDFESRKISFGPITHTESVMPFYAGLPFLVLPLYVQDQPVRLLLDTGARDLILFRRRVDGRIAMNKTRGRKGIGSRGGTATLKKVVLPEVSMGQTRWEELGAFLLDGPAPSSGIDGVLGVSSLGLKSLHLDFQQSLISWER